MDEKKITATAVKKKNKMMLGIVVGFVLLLLFGVGGYFLLKPAAPVITNTVVTPQLPQNGAVGDEYPDMVDTEMEDSPLLNPSVGDPLPSELWSSQIPQLKINATGIFSVNNYPVYSGDKPEFFDPPAVAGNPARLKIFDDSKSLRIGHLTMVNNMLKALFAAPSGFNAYLEKNFSDKGKTLLLNADAAKMSDFKLSRQVVLSGMMIITNSELAIPGSSMNVSGYYNVAGTCTYAGTAGTPFNLSFGFSTDEKGAVVQLSEVAFNYTDKAGKDHSLLQ